MAISDKKSENQGHLIHCLIHVIANIEVDEVGIHLQTKAHFLKGILWENASNLLPLCHMYKPPPFTP